VAQPLKIDLASAHDRRCIGIVSQSKQKVSLRGIWVTPLFGDGERPVQRLVQALGKDGHGADALLLSRMMAMAISAHSPQSWLVPQRAQNSGGM
jgi:hypothetical protein